MHKPKPFNISKHMSAPLTLEQMAKKYRLTVLELASIAIWIDTQRKNKSKG